MTNRLADTEIWKKDWFLELTDKQKLLTKFLFDNCDCAGFYKISWNLLKCFFNEPPVRADFEKIKQVKFIQDNLVFIEDFALFQCKVKSFKDLNPNNKAHLGVLRLLKKYGVYDSPLEAPLKPLQRGTGIGIGIGIGNTTNKLIDTSNNNNVDKIEKFDPFINPIKTFFLEEYKKEMGNIPRLSSFECNRLLELSANNPDIKELIPEAVRRLKRIDFGDIQFTPSASWLLKGNNFERVINGEFEPKKTDYERLREKFCGGG